MALDAVALLGTHSADIIKAQGKIPIRCRRHALHLKPKTQKNLDSGAGSRHAMPKNRKLRCPHHGHVALLVCLSSLRKTKV